MSHSSQMCQGHPVSVSGAKLLFSLFCFISRPIFGHICCRCSCLSAAHSFSIRCQKKVFKPFLSFILKVILLFPCPEESLGKIFVMKQSEMMMTNVCGLALGYQWDRLSNVVTGWVTVLTFGRRQLCSGQSGTDCQLWILGTFHEYSDQVIIYLALIAA